MKILVVDDEPIANFITCRLFKQIDPALEIVDYTDSQQAVFHLNEIDPDLVFLDLNMPYMDGWAFLDRMIANKLEYKVYILTSSVSTFDQNKAKRYANVVDCLEKPLKKERLRECIES